MMEAELIMKISKGKLLDIFTNGSSWCFLSHLFANEVSDYALVKLLLIVHDHDEQLDGSLYQLVVS